MLGLDICPIKKDCERRNPSFTIFLYLYNYIGSLHNQASDDLNK